MKVKNITLLFCLLAYHAHLTPAHAQSSLAASLAGDWQFVAANNGVEVAPGIYSAGTDVVNFTATASADGTSLQCHADNMYDKTGTTYAADWRILVEEDGAGKHRLGWVLDNQQPAFTTEFNEPQENYLEKGFFYWGGTEGAHRYVYLLAENADASAIVGMTFWSPWSDGSTTEYSLANEENNSRKIYAVVAENIPYGNSVGWIEIWSSPKVKKVADNTAISTITADGMSTNDAWYDLRGRKITNGRLPKGVYIHNGKKVVISHP